MAKKAGKGRAGQYFDDFLEEEGILDEVTAGAVKKLVAMQLREAMAAGDVTKVAMAKRMETSRTQLDRVLDPENDKVSLEILMKAAAAVGRRIRVELV